MNPETELTALQVQLMLNAIKGHRQRLPFPKVLSDEQLASISMPTLLLLGEKTVINRPREAAMLVSCPQTQEREEHLRLCKGVDCLGPWGPAVRE